MAGDMVEIDPVKYGVLWQKVQEMEKKIDRIENRVDQLLELANRSKGGLWLGLTIITSVTAIAGLLIRFFGER